MLPAPFFVLATQNPLEQEGTYPLPEAQLDRFLLYIKVNYLGAGQEEWEIARRVTVGGLGKIQPCLSGDDIIQPQQVVTRVPVSDQVLGFAQLLVRASRPRSAGGPGLRQQSGQLGCRAAWCLDLGDLCQARALLFGRYHATVADVLAAKPARAPDRRELCRPGQQYWP